MMLAHTGCLHRFMANGEVWPEGEQQPEHHRHDRDAEEPAPGALRQGPAGLRRVPGADVQPEITEHGLKTVIPDLIVALRAIEESL